MRLNLRERLLRLLGRPERTEQNGPASPNPAVATEGPARDSKDWPTFRDYLVIAKDFSGTLRAVREEVPTAPLEKTVEHWLARKEEKQALVALILEDVWPSISSELREKLNRTTELGDSFGEGAEPPFRQPEDVATAFSRSIGRWVQAQEQIVANEPPEDWSHLTRVFRRYDDLHHLRLDIGYTHPESSTADSLIRGVRTAQSVISDLLKDAPALLKAHHIPVTRANLTALVRSGYGPYVNALASVHANVMISMTESTRKMPFSVAQGPGGQPKLVFDAEGLLKEAVARDGGLVVPAALPGGTTGCPAKKVMGLEGKDIIREMFVLMVEVAEKTLYATYPP